MKIQGYGLMIEGTPLCVYSSSYSMFDHYILSKDRGMPYMVDLDTMRYYLTKYMDSDHADLHPQHAPDDYRKLLPEATPCHIQVSIVKGDMFSLRVATCPLDHTLVPYKVLPKGCLDDTKSGPINTRVIKKLRYTPPDLGGEYVDRHGHYVDTYIDTSGDCHLFKREHKYPKFYPTFEMGAFTSLEEYEYDD